MYIKFIKNTKTNKQGQVVEGDYKILIKAVKRGDAEVSDHYEQEKYIGRLKQAHAETTQKRIGPAKPSEKVEKQKEEAEDCLPCLQKKQRLNK